ncbi:MAG TPA: hydrogenase maturation protease [Spirillospora sp.]
MARVLVAGIGNVFLGDDAFGVEVARRLGCAGLPEEVRVADYGIRGVHLAYELLDGDHDTLILVDAMPVDGPPGTLAVLHVDTETLDGPVDGEAPDDAQDGADGADGATPGAADPFGPPAVDGHGMDPMAVLRLLRRLGGDIGRVLVVGCRPAVLDERMELSAPVLAALDEAVRLVAELARDEARRDAANPVAANPGALKTDAANTDALNTDRERTHA